MLRTFFKDKKDKKATAYLYAGLVGRARHPVFYRELGVPDTIDGRFDLILLHLFLVTHHLEMNLNEAALSRLLQEKMIDDMDRSLREMGVGDMSVGKKIKAMATAWFGRREAYGGALGAGKEQIEKAISLNVFRLDQEHPASNVLANYVIEMLDAFQGISPVDFRSAKFEWDELSLPEIVPNLRKNNE